MKRPSLLLLALLLVAALGGCAGASFAVEPSPDPAPVGASSPALWLFLALIVLCTRWLP